MAVKRFISTDLVNQSWYSELKPKHKALWLHLLLVCDCAGSFELSPRLLTAYVGEEITERDVFGTFGNRVVRWGDKGLITGFVRYQYYGSDGQRLSPNCKTHQFVLKRLASLGLTEDKLDELASAAMQAELPLDIPRQTSRRGAKFVKPTVEEVRAYCTERNNEIDAAQFWNWYESKGWKVGNTPMKDWKAAIVTWELRRNGNAGGSGETAFVDPNYEGRGGF